MNTEPNSKSEPIPPLLPATGSADERAILINAVEWLALEVIHHGDKCTCGSCHAVAACADIIEAKNSKYIANTIRRQLAAKNPPNNEVRRSEMETHE